MQFVTVDLPDHKVLRQRAKEVTFPLNPEVKQFIADMHAFILTLSAAGLAAPQIGKSWRIAFIEVPPEAKQYRKLCFDEVALTLLINASYTPTGGEKYKDWEGCFSVPGKMGEVYRYNTIRYEYYDIDGNKFEGIAKGFLARVLQHEIDHLDGIIYTDLLSSDCRFGNVDEMIELRKQELANAN